MVAPVGFFYPDSKLHLSQHGRLHAVSFETASRDTQTLNLWRHVSKFYAREVVSLMNGKQSQNLLLKVVAQGEKLETRGTDMSTHAKLKSR